MKHDYVITAIFEGKAFKPVIRKTEKGVSDYANRMYRKFYNKYGYRGECGLTVEFGYFNDNMDWIPCGTYHA